MGPGAAAPNAVPGWFFDSRYELPDYSLLNARVRYTNPGGDWEVALFANNLTDEVYGNYATRFGGGAFCRSLSGAPSVCRWAPIG